MKITKATKQKILCAVLLIVGLGLCIGGVWLSPLLGVGIPIFSAGLGVAADIYDDKTRNTVTNVYNYATGNVPETIPAAIVEKAIASPIRHASHKTLVVVKKAVEIMKENVMRKRDAENNKKNTDRLQNAQSGLQEEEKQNEDNAEYFKNVQHDKSMQHDCVCGAAPVVFRPNPEEPFEASSTKNYKSNKKLNII